MDVHIFDQQQDLVISPEEVINVIQEVLRKEGKNCDEVAVHFVTHDAICELHSTYFDDPEPTDCISFPIDEPGISGYCVLGEVFVCPKTAIDYADAHHTNPYEETTLYIVHGLLHLLGYDDIDEEVEKMREAEQRHMKNLKNLNLLLDFKD